MAIPLAAGVLASWGIVLSPAAGAVLMSLSTIIVAATAQPFATPILGELSGGGLRAAAGQHVPQPNNRRCRQPWQYSHNSLRRSR